MTKYQIRWTSKFTNETGLGTGTFPKGQAEYIAKGLNNQPDAIRTHQAVLYNKAIQADGTDSEDNQT